MSDRAREDLEQLTQVKLRSILTYDPQTGLFHFVKSMRHKNKGDKAGHINNGYIIIPLYINGEIFGYRAHRLAWLYMTGKMPLLDIDHINGDKIDNRWENLRLATVAQNCVNTGKRVDNTSGFKNVSFHKPSGKWTVVIKVKKKSRYFGLHEDIELADFIAQEARELYHGEFACN